MRSIASHALCIDRQYTQSLPEYHVSTQAVELHYNLYVYTTRIVVYKSSSIYIAHKLQCQMYPSFTIFQTDKQLIIAYLDSYFSSYRPSLWLEEIVSPIFYREYYYINNNLVSIQIQLRISISCRYKPTKHPLTERSCAAFEELPQK